MEFAINRIDGAAQQAEQQRRLSAGPLSALLSNGELRYVRVGGVEIVRRLFVTVRDEAWGTIVGQARGADIQENELGFDVRTAIEFARPPVALKADVMISARYDAAARAVEVGYRLQGTALGDFWIRRTGLCLLHPIKECAGRPCVVSRADGEGGRGAQEQGEFPQLIAPSEPFRDVQKLSYSASHGLDVTVEFGGEVFETEDQRNWSDGSFKTYCRPLSKPAPYKLTKGQLVEQNIHVRVCGAGNVNSYSERTTVAIDRDTRHKLPQIGSCIPLHEVSPSEQEIGALTLLNLRHLRIDVTASAAEQQLTSLRQLLTVRAIPLEVGVHFGGADNGTLTEVVHAVTSVGQVARWIAYDDGQPFVSSESVERLQSAVRGTGEMGIVGGGTVGNFTELNRSRVVAGGLRLLAYPLNPQMHAMDDLSIVENLESHGDTVRTVRSFASEDARIAVSPVTFHRRPDPFATGKSGEEIETVQPDPRQRTGLAAAWTIGSIAELVPAGADSITYFDVFGPFGVINGSQPTPVKEVLSALLEWEAPDVLGSTVSQPLTASALALRSGGRIRLIVGNLWNAEQQIQLPHSIPTDATCRCYGSARHSVELLRVTQPVGNSLLPLAPYECAVIDWEDRP